MRVHCNSRFTEGYTCPPQFFCVWYEYNKRLIILFRNKDLYVQLPAYAYTLILWIAGTLSIIRDGGVFIRLFHVEPML